MNASEVWEVEVRTCEETEDPRGAQLRARIEEAGASVPSVGVADLYFFTGPTLDRSSLREISERLLADSVTQQFSLRGPGDSAEGPDRGEMGASATVLKKPGVMDPVEGSLIQALGDMGVEGVRVATGARFDLGRPLGLDEQRLLAEKVLSNPVIEDVHWRSGDGSSEWSPFP